MKLRPYQEEDEAKLRSKPAMGNFNEQRTGKTPTSLVACQRYGATKILIVAPASLLYNWADECQTWIDRSCVIVDGYNKKKKIKQIAGWTECLAINYESLRVTKNKKTKEIISEGLIDLILKHKPDAVILDEAHRIKGRTTATAKAVQKLAKIEYKLALTGTPAPNRQDDVWAILHWLYPKHFSSYWDWIGEWFKSQTMEAHGQEITIPIRMKPELVPRFQNILDAIATQRKRKDVMPWLPDTPAPMKIRLPLSAQQEKYLDNLYNWFEADHIVTQGVLDRLIRIRQICNSPKLLGLAGEGPKLNWIKQYLTDYPNRPTIIFSRFSKWLHYVKEKTNGVVEVYDGSLNLSERTNLINQFQSGKINVLAIQIDAGKEGLTLDRAECLIFTDVMPPASDIAQARDRIVATTPSKAHIPKQVIELMMKDSYDESLYQMVKENRDATSIINDFKQYINKRRVM